MAKFKHNPLLVRKQAYVEGTNTLAGAIGTMWFCIKNLLQWSGCSLVHALQAASLHPAQALGIDKSKGQNFNHISMTFIHLGWPPTLQKIQSQEKYSFFVSYKCRRAASNWV